MIKNILIILWTNDAVSVVLPFIFEEFFEICFELLGQRLIIIKFFEKEKELLEAFAVVIIVIEVTRTDYHGHEVFCHEPEHEATLEQDKDADYTLLISLRSNVSDANCRKCIKSKIRIRQESFQPWLVFKLIIAHEIYMLSARFSKVMVNKHKPQSSWEIYKENSGNEDSDRVHDHLGQQTLCDEVVWFIDAVCFGMIL